MDIQKALRLIQKHNPDINRGGCGIAALSTIRWADKNNKPIPESVFLYTSWEKDMAEENQSLIKNGHIKDCYVPAHIALLVDDRVIDSDGVIDSGLYPVTHMDVSPGELLVLINRGDWNDTFVRKVGVPKIMGMLKIDLSDIVLEE